MVRNQIESCIKRIQSASGDLLTEDEVKDLLKELSDSISNNGQSIDLYKALALADKLKNNPLTKTPERITLNKVRVKLYENIGLLNGIQKVDALADAGLSKIDALNVLYRGADNAEFTNPITGVKEVPEGANNGLLQLVQGYMTRTDGKVSEWLDKHGVDLLPKVEQDKLLEDIFEVSRGRAAVNRYSQAAADFTAITDETRMMINARGGDLEASHDLLFNPQVDSLKLAGKEARETFDALWGADKFAPEDWDAIRGNLVSTNEFRQVLKEAMEQNPELERLIESSITRKTAMGVEKNIRLRDSKGNLKLPSASKLFGVASEKLDAVYKETAFRIMSDHKKMVENLPMDSAKIQNHTVMRSSMNIVGQLNSRNLAPFKTYADWKAFQQRFGEVRNISGLLSHNMRNARLASYMYHTSPNPESWLRGVEAYILGQDTADIPLHDLARIKAAREAAGGEKTIFIQRDKKGKPVFRKEAVTKEGEVLYDVKFDKDGNLRPETLPFEEVFDPLLEKVRGRKVPRIPIEDIIVRETALADPQGLKASLRRIEAIPPEFRNDNAIHWHRVLSGESFFEGKGSRLGVISSNITATLNLAKLGNVLFAQPSDFATTAGSTAVFRKGKASRGRLGGTVAAVQDTVDAFGFTIKQMRDSLFAGTPMGSRIGKLLTPKDQAKALRQIDQVGMALASNLRGSMTLSHFAENINYQNAAPSTKSLLKLQQLTERYTGVSRLSQINRLYALNRIHEFVDQVVKPGLMTPEQKAVLKGVGLTTEDLTTALKYNELGMPYLDINNIKDTGTRHKMTGFIYGELQSATGIVDMTTQNLRRLGTDPNTPIGAIASLATHMFSYTFNYYTKTLPRMWQRNGAVSTLANLGTVALIYGPLMGSVKDLIKGETPPDYISHPEEFALDFVRGLTLQFGLIVNLAEVGGYVLERAQGKDAYTPELQVGMAVGSLTDAFKELMQGLGEASEVGGVLIDGAMKGDDRAWQKAKREFRRNPKILRQAMGITSFFAPAIALTTKSPAAGALSYGLFNWWGSSILREPAFKAIEAAENPRRGRMRKKRREETGQTAFIQPAFEGPAEGVVDAVDSILD